MQSNSIEWYGQWLLSIPSVEARALEGMAEYRDLAICLDRLGKARAGLVQHQGERDSSDPQTDSLLPAPHSYLQHCGAVDVLHHILYFLEAHMWL